MLLNGFLQSGIQVTLNGIGNITDNRNFFDNWYYSAGMGFVGGAVSGYNLSKQRGLNYWWGTSVEDQRTQWSFFTSELPYERLHFGVNNVGSKNLNDCVPTTFTEANDFFGGDISYEEFKRRTRYEAGVGSRLNRSDYESLLSDHFSRSVFNPSLLNDPQNVRQFIDRGYLINVNMELKGVRHADNIRSINYYRSGKIEMKLRVGTYRVNTNDHNNWFYLLRSIR